MVVSFSIQYVSNLSYLHDVYSIKFVDNSIPSYEGIAQFG